MKFALSGRIFESQGGYTLGLRNFLATAARLGYEGVEIRLPQLPLETPADKADQVAGWLREFKLDWVFGTVGGIVGDEALADAVGMLRLHQRCGCLFSRFTLAKPEDIEWGKRFADEAASLDHKVIMQLHNGTLTDTVPHCIETLSLLDRPNAGLAFEACHIRFAGSERYAEAIRELRDRIFSVSLQNYKPALPVDPPETRITINNRPYVRAFPGDPDGIDFAEVFQALHEIGFDGYATVMADAAPGADRTVLARDYLNMCRSLTR